MLSIPPISVALALLALGALPATALDVAGTVTDKLAKPLAEVKICVAYDLDGERLDEPPMDAADIARCTPVYETLECWSGNMSAIRTLEALPKSARDYIERIEKAVECPISLISVGADREQTIALTNPFA